MRLKNDFVAPASHPGDEIVELKTAIAVKTKCPFGVATSDGQPPTQSNVQHTQRALCRAFLETPPNLRRTRTVRSLQSLVSYPSFKSRILWPQ